MVLAEETCQGEEAEKVKTNLVMELAVLHDQMVKAASSSRSPNPFSTRVIFTMEMGLTIA